MLLGVAIVTHNSAEVVADCLASVTALMPEAIVCVADNDSTDRTVERILAMCSQATVIHTGGNLGYASACNQVFTSLEALGADIILLINPDVVLSEASVNGIILAFEDGSVTHAAGAFHAPDRSGLLAATPHWFELLRYSLLLALPRGLSSRSLMRRWMRRGTYASGALVAVRTSAWRRVGRFDEDYFLYYEDRDFSERLQAFGRLTPLPGVAGVHRQGTSSGSVPRAFQLRAALSGWLLYVAKHDGRQAALRWCASTACVHRVVAAALFPLSLVRVRRARCKRTELLDAAAFLSKAMASVEPRDEDDRPAAVLSRALRWEG